ncbi:AraC family transcriptional regulator [Aureibaculum sp. 2210JD6-5]|uniref:helix-turn-helix domain-containing protein n=1 Tax=Aureibaculum sp. 2210JD6-5 TaxID=3103957 RepID=UPI002AAEF023|nr:AraC family transcriptional regulator [Aureibaculum sp. 2210JD6-5]MDY7396091.1 AraC family transcriptional regulator [Aureibaculum sp. 2210JD6-5]
MRLTSSIATHHSYYIVYYSRCDKLFSLIYNMKLVFKGKIEESSFILTNFNCAPAQALLQDKGYYKIIWAREKTCKLMVDGYELELERHQVLFSTTLNVLNIPKDVGVIAIVFNREFYCIRDHDHEVSCNGMLFFGSSQPPVIMLNEKEQRSFETIFSIFKEEFETQDHIQGEMLRVMLKRLLIKSTRLITESRNAVQIEKPQLDIIRKFHVLVEQHFKNKHQVMDYASLMGKSPKTISTLFKKAGHETPLTVINERLLLEAKRLLLFSDKTAEEIAFELGYREGAHFSKFFKSHIGIPPVSFRELKLGKQKTV